LRVICWCGTDFQTISDIAMCPVCHAIATLPRLTAHDEQNMDDALRRLTQPPDD
jgi:hypothetical protein